MFLDSSSQILLAPSPGGRDGREDAAAGCVQLLVARSARALLELRGPAPQKRSVGVTVHEPRQRDPSPAVEGFVVRAGWYSAQDLSRRTDGRDAATADRDGGGGLDLQLSEFPAPQRPPSLWGDGGLEVVDEE